jgi:hypothetical protein
MMACALGYNCKVKSSRRDESVCCGILNITEEKYRGYKHIIGFMKIKYYLLF